LQTVNRRTTFELRQAAGYVEITYAVNEDPARWGFDLLHLDFDINAARGFPVMEARAKLAREGYAALLGWIQVIDYTVTHESGPEEMVWIAPDVSPQVREANTPYTSFGIEPVIFDAPAFTEKNVDWTARTFLTYTPDCLMTPIVEPLCGFTWGYVITDGVVTPKDLEPAVLDDWIAARKVLRLRLPTWTFEGADWNPSRFDS
jgi:hypothetical protein